MRGATADNKRIVRLEMNENKKLDIQGVFGVTWKTLEKRLNFTTDFYLTRDKTWGGRLPNGTWTGIVSQILSDEVEVAIGDFTMTLLRHSVVDYTLPLFLSKLQVYIRRPSTLQLNWRNFLAPFTPTLWLATAVLILFLGVTLTCFYHVARRHCEEDVATPPAKLGDSLLLVLGLMCQQGVDRPPRSASCRVIHWFTGIVSIVFYSAYAAALISSLTAQIIVLPFETFEELLKDGTYKLGVLGNSGHSNLLDTSSDLLLSKLYDNLVLPHKDGLIHTVEEGMRHVCRQDKYAFFTSRVLVQAMADSLECEVLALPHATIPANEGIILPKKSPYRNILNYNLMMIRNYGIFNRDRIQIMPSMPQPSQSPLHRVSLWELAPIFTIVAVGVVGAATLLATELFAAYERRASPRDAFLHNSLAASSRMKYKRDNTRNRKRRTRSGVKSVRST